MGANVMTPKFRVSFPNAFRPAANKNDPNAEPKYSLTMLFGQGADLTALKAAAHAAAVAKFGPNQAEWPRLKSPFRDQGEMDPKKYPGYVAGCVFIRASSKQKPGLVDQAKNDIINESDFYAGCYARATVRAFHYAVKGNQGIAFGLQNIQKLADGEPLGGRTSAQQDFEPVEVPATGGAASVFGGTDSPF